MLVNKTLAHDRVKAAAAALIFGGAALLAAPAHADTDFDMVSIGSLDIGDEEEFFEQLVELDADDIAEIREDMADARADIADAIADIDDAREEVRGKPGAGAILKTALKVASAIVDNAIEKAFNEVEDALVVAEARLEAERSALGEAEYAETGEAIGVIREGMASLDAAVDELVAAMRS